MLAFVISNDIIDVRVLLVMGKLSIRACYLLLCHVKVRIVHSKVFLFDFKSFLASTVLIGRSYLEQNLHELLTFRVHFMELLLYFVNLR